MNEGWKEAVSPRRPHKLGCQWPRPCNKVGSWDSSRDVKPEIVGVPGANMQWGRFVCPSSSQKEKSIALELILQSAWGLPSPGKQVGRSSIPFENGAKFGEEKVNGRQNICSRDASVGNGKHFKKQAQSSKS